MRHFYQVILNTKPSLQMDPNSSFVIAGGLGGLGRATARWMAERGARNIILLSRFGPRTDSARELIKNLQSIGVRVETPACDVTDLHTMKQIFGRLSANMPPIKGVLQMSVIARVSAPAFALLLIISYSFSRLTNKS